jgi:hypothetical protein
MMRASTRAVLRDSAPRHLRLFLAPAGPALKPSALLAT